VAEKGAHVTDGDRGSTIAREIVGQNQAVPPVPPRHPQEENQNEILHGVSAFKRLISWQGNSNSPGNAAIGDPEFMSRLNQLLALRSFLTKQAVPLTGCAATGSLNILRFDRKGRFPTEAEWLLLDQHTEALFGLLSEPLRRKFLSSQIPAWLTKTAIVLGVAALFAFLTAAIGNTGLFPSGSLFSIFYESPVFNFLVWAASLGAVGSIAFIGMNALAVQDDATFDLTNEKLIVLRIVLGALFAVVLTLPFGYGHFLEFLRDLSKPVSTPDSLSRASMLLLPFVLGFSTTVVIMILNRFVEAIQSFFGRPGNAPTVVVVPAPVPNPLATDRSKQQ
jgi:hypothetical protein